METNFALPLDLGVRGNTIGRPDSAQTGEKTSGKTKVRTAEQAKTFTINKGFVFSLFLILGVMFFITFSSAQLTQISDGNVEMERELNQLRQQERQLETRLSGGMSLAQVEDYARNTLGMIKIDSTQVEYINMANTDKVWIAADDRDDQAGFFAGAAKYLSLVYEYIN